MSIMRQDIGTLPLAPSIRHHLLGSGIKTVLELDGHDAESLAAVSAMKVEEANEVLGLAGCNHLPGWRLNGVKSAAELLQECGVQSRHISTRCAELDTVLGGGIALKQVTELCGVPGVGKTQIGIQLAVNVQVPLRRNDVQGSAIYIDTEGSFMIERVVDMADAAVRDLQAQGHMPPTTREDILSNIMIFRIHSHTEQLALINCLPAFLQSQPQVRLIVLDSVSLHFRQGFRDMALRARVLGEMAQKLSALAERCNVAVVMMNQVTTKVTEGAPAQLIPALGESWGQAASTRVMLQWKGPERQAYVAKAPAMPPAYAFYTITNDGVRGI